MAKKKKTRQKETPSEFINSPFKSLKGLSAYEPEKSSSVQDEVRSGDQKTASPASEDDQASFAEEMQFLGVKRINGHSQVDAGSEQDHEKPHNSRSREECEESVFLDAVGSMEKVFKDEWPSEETTKPAVPRRMKLVQRGQLKPGAELDLHGLTVDEASAKVRFFLQNSIYHHLDVVLVITGKGLHSDDGPVLRKAIEALLTQQRDLVVEWGVAPRRYGGDGALVVFLRH